MVTLQHLGHGGVVIRTHKLKTGVETADFIHNNDGTTAEVVIRTRKNPCQQLWSVRPGEVVQILPGPMKKPGKSARKAVTT